MQGKFPLKLCIRSLSAVQGALAAAETLAARRIVSVAFLMYAEGWVAAGQYFSTCLSSRLCLPYGNTCGVGEHLRK